MARVTAQRHGEGLFVHHGQHGTFLMWQVKDISTAVCDAEQ